ncbi:trafficking regulator of GLUT4 1 [Nomascus leucogenys]|uniref:trafficking regulator of GLUT4 1 n=1 Tax=Nomascus leucogenys TaxID=61853 RepID=UPI00122D5EC1|nr:trafficking regulator of GLUT4 1 [Nomascus leucogenys]
MANPVQSDFPSAQEPGSTAPLDLLEMDKLLTKAENKDDKTLNLSKTLLGPPDLEQNGHGLPFKAISEGHLEAPLPRSPSCASSRRASSIATASYAQDQEAPRDYLILAVVACFCPVWPLNLIPLIISIMELSSEKAPISSDNSVYFSEARSPTREAFPIPPKPVLPFRTSGALAAFLSPRDLAWALEAGPGRGLSGSSL